MTDAPTIRDRIVELRRVPADQLIANPKNWRQHPDRQRRALRGLLEDIGFADVLLARETPDGLMLIDGHLRAEELRSQDVPVVVLDLSEEEADKLLLTLDPLAGMAGADAEALTALLEGVTTNSDAVQSMFDDLARVAGDLMAVEGKVNPDDAPALSDHVEAQRGDVYRLGDHRLMCGDATVQGDVLRLLGDEMPGMMVTDPPYGVDYDPAWRERYDPRWNYSTAEVTNDNRGDWGAAIGLWKGTVIYLWHASLHVGEVALSLAACHLEPRAHIIWRKPSSIFSQGHYHWQHEPCFYAVRKGAAARWKGDRKQSTVWDIPNVHATQGTSDDMITAHSTQKPVELMERPMRNHRIAAVYDPFVGSGTTLIAAERTRRRCYAMDIEPAYVDLSVRRWEQYTGEKAVKEKRRG